MAFAFINSAPIQPVINQEVVVCTLAGGPFDNLDAFVSGGAWAGGSLVFRIYAIVGGGGLRSLVAQGTYGGPSPNRILWTIIDQPGQLGGFAKDQQGRTNQAPLHVGGTSFDLVVFAAAATQQQGPTFNLGPANPAPILATLAGCNSGDAVPDTNSSPGPIACGAGATITYAVAGGFIDEADVGFNAAGMPTGLIFQLLANCGPGSVEVPVATVTTGPATNLNADVMVGIPLPVATIYRLRVTNTSSAGVNITASLSTYTASTAGGGGGPVIMSGNDNGPSNANHVEDFQIESLNANVVGAQYAPIAAGLWYVGMSGAAGNLLVSLLDTMPNGSRIIVKDEDGGLAAHSYTVSGSTGLLIDGAATFVMNAANPGPFGAVTFEKKVSPGGVPGWAVVSNYAQANPATVIEMVFAVAGPSLNVLGPLQAAGVLPAAGTLRITIEGFGGTGGAGGGQGGAAGPTPGIGGGASGAVQYSTGSFDFNLADTLDIIVGAGGAFGAAGVAAGGAGGDGGDGLPSYALQHT
ncbi:MAG: hypothetical protein ACHREM_18040, partial [Polyangiales bacterium]